MNLFELTGQYQQVYNLITEQGDEQILTDTLAAINDALEEKADGYAAVIRSLEADNDAIDKEVKRLQQLKTANTNGVKRMKDALKDAMIQTGKTKFKTALNSYSIRNNAPSLDITDESLITNDFYIEQEPKLDKKALLQYVKDNGEFQGVSLKTTQSLVVK